MIKTLTNFSVLLMRELFHQKVNHYDLRNPYEFSFPNVKRVFSWKSEYIVPRSIHTAVNAI